MSEQQDESAFKQAWDALDNDEERIALLRHDQMQDLHKLAMEKMASSHRKEGGRKSMEKDVEKEIKGPILKDDEPITLSFVQSMIESFLQNIKLRSRYVERVVREVTKINKESPLLQRITIPKNGKVVIVGDTHGQLHDVIEIFKHGGWPSENTVYIINGDMVDRGPYGPEVLFIFYSLKLAFPNYLYINRGNHESRKMNTNYKFEDQIFDKYDQNIYEAIQKSFNWLPLCSLIQEKVFVVHGGLHSEVVTLEELENLNIKRGDDLKSHSRLKDREEFIVESLLWSDPDPELKKGYEKSSRGAGIRFSEEILDEFLETNNLSFMIRSHELVDSGFEHIFVNKCATLFSASCYTMSNDNKGAIALYAEDTKDWSKPEIIHFKADVRSKEDRKKNLQEHTLYLLYERVYSDRHQLRCELSKVADEDGMVKVDDWDNIMTTVLRLKLNWKPIRPYLVDVENDKINYVKFLKNYKVHANKQFTKLFQADVIRHLCSEIKNKKINLEKLFKQFDIDKSGKISYVEFIKDMKSLDIGLTNDQIQDLMDSIDKNKDGYIDFEEFESFLGISYRNACLEKWQRNFISTLRDYLKKEHGSLEKAFINFHDKDDDDSSIDFKRFVRNLDKIEEFKKLKEDEKLSLFKYIDLNDSGQINRKEFTRALDPPERKEKWETALIQRVYDTLRHSKSQLRSLFRKMDKDGTKSVDVDEFKAGLEAMNLLLDCPLSDTQIARLHAALDKDGDGYVDYEEFLEGFTVTKKVHKSK